MAGMKVPQHRLRPALTSDVSKADQERAEHDDVGDWRHMRRWEIEGEGFAISS